MAGLHCTIVESGGRPVRPPPLLHALQALEGELTLAAADAGDVMLLVVDAASHAQALATLSAGHARAAAVVIAVGSDLDGGQIEALLAAGAADYLSLAHADHELAARLRRVLGLLAGVAPSPAAGPRAHGLRNVIGHNTLFLQQVAKLEQYAATEAGVLITGETGTGKEVFAQAIHYLSGRASRPWVAVNCGAIPSELIESELFGHVRGAFTHAQTAREGLVREAEHGTLFLDDIDCMPLPAQAKLLRFLQEGEYRRVGSNTVQTADVRVIASSNRKPAELAAQHGFRQDLYYRLAVLTLALPALRERREDIPELAHHFLQTCAGRGRTARAQLTPLALARLMAHHWPGNVRELKHVIERAVVLSRGPQITADAVDFGDGHAAGEAGGTFREAKARIVDDFERGFIESLLATHQGNVTHAALAAQKNRRAFFELMRKHHIDPARFRD